MGGVEIDSFRHSRDLEHILDAELGRDAVPVADLKKRVRNQVHMPPGQSPASATKDQLFWPGYGLERPFETAHGGLYRRDSFAGLIDDLALAFFLRQADNFDDLVDYVMHTDFLRERHQLLQVVEGLGLYEVEVTQT
jgi:hypothetical protein